MDFTNFPTKHKAYGGANGSKLSVVYQGNTYMLKLPSHAPRNPNLSYTNSCISEYLGCHIFNMLGIRAQETILGTFEYHGKTREVVACKDFTSPGIVFQDFASIKNQIIDSKSNGYGTDIQDILETIEKQQVVDPKKLMDFFWDMFVIDALIGNWDRHNGNWGFLYSEEKDEMDIAPVFDCGSSLYPQIDDKLIQKVLSSKKEMEARVYELPTSAIMVNGTRANYYQITISHAYPGLNAAIKRIVPKINLSEINNLIDSVASLSKIHKTFLKNIVALRKELILDKAYYEAK